MKSRIKEWALNTILVIVSSLITFVLFEAGYRYYRYVHTPKYFLQEIENPRSVPFYSHSIWEFDENLGFRYRRDSPVLVGGISNGKLASCGVLDPKELGGIGKKERWTENADLRILVLGDSFTARSANGRSWPDYLQDELQRRLGKRVDVINLGMDGIGIMQMLRVAAHSVPALKPDLVIVAFTTDDITRGMFWRTTARIAGRTRAFTTTRPERAPDLRYAVDTVVINDKITLEWCNKSPKPDRANDRVVQDIELRYRLGVGLSESRADLYGLDRSLVIERIIYGPTLRPPLKKSVNPRHDLTSFSEDARTRSDAELIKRHAPVMLFHVTQRTEVRMKTSYVFNEEQRQVLLLQSLKDLFDTAIAETSDHLPPDLDIEAMGMSKEDDHPSPYGMSIYARAAAEALLGRCQPAVKACGRFN